MKPPRPALNLNKVIWLERGWMPTYYGFCPSEKAWNRELARLNVPPSPYPTAAGCCTHLESAEKKRCVLVTVAERMDRQMKSDRNTVSCLIVHEAVHVWQAIRDHIGEKEPSSEFEAYAVQNISECLMDAYVKTRHMKAPATKRRSNDARRRGRKRSR